MVCVCLLKGPKMLHKNLVNLINCIARFLEIFLQEISFFFSFLTRNQKPRKMRCVVESEMYISNNTPTTNESVIENANKDEWKNYPE